MHSASLFHHPISVALLFCPPNSPAVYANARKNNDRIILNGIEDLVREFMDDVPPDLFALRRPCLRMLLNAEKGMSDLFLEFGS
jgi:hypothetical protein